MAARRVVILGGGVTGLAVAHALLRAGEACDITVLERETHLGGNIRTLRRDGFVLDGGPDSWVATKPHATLLAKSLGLEPRFIPTIPANRRVYIAWGERLHPLPEGMVLGVPTEILPIVKTPLFTWGAKFRMGLEPFVARRAWTEGEDESIGDFVSRRLGAQVTERLAGPLLGGIFAGDAHELSVVAAFPQFVEAEKKHGSLVGAMRALRAARRTGSGEGSAFLSLQGGLGEFIDALGAKVGARARVRLGTAARRVDARGERAAEGYRVLLDTGEALEADDVVLALPLAVAAEVARTLDAPLGEALGAFTAASTATAFLAFPASAIPRPLDAAGFLVPRSARKSILAATWVSSKWDHRAPEGSVLLRVFFGGATDEGILERDDAGLVALAREELRRWMGVEAAPLFSHVFRFHRASPQPRVGHLARVAAVKAKLARWPGLHVAGNGFEGSGIPDCVKFAEAVAAAIGARPRAREVAPEGRRGSPD
ncbi:MAG TPA: protoporphyrinogen oxidase [Polyangiaceae bacterium]|jgi:oxygen-dependent protoporphyrinogen oxidase